MHYFREMDRKNPYIPTEWGLFRQEVIVAEKSRRFLTYVPDGIKPSAALVIILGPNGCSAEELAEKSGWKELADDQKFVVFFLESENGEWNIHEPYGFPDGDIAYVNAVFVKGCEGIHYCVHESKKYLFGVNEGGCIAQMAAMSEPALYAGMATVGANEVSHAYCAACGSDYCRNLNGFVDPTVRKGIRKSDIPMPVWICDDPERGSEEMLLSYWIRVNRAEGMPYLANDDVAEYSGTEEMQSPVSQDKGACRVWKSEWPGASQNYGKEKIGRIWKTFLSQHQRWMAEPGGSLRFAQNPVQDLGMEYHFEEIDGWMREWYVYVPECVKKDPKTKVPLVFAMHGYGCTGEIYAGNTNWHQVARERGFIVVYPTAAPGKLDIEAENLDLQNILMPSWNYRHFSPDGPDELLFFKELLQRVSAEYPIDPTRIYATGHSQGSMMTQTLALALPDVFAAVAPCSGVILVPSSEDYVSFPEFQNSLPVPIWMFAGQEEQWLIDAEPRPDNATGKTISFWHSRNCLSGNAEDRFQGHWSRHKDRWLDLCYENESGWPMLRYTQVEYFPHATMPEMSWRIWDEFFACWSRTANGLIYHNDV